MKTILLIICSALFFVGLKAQEVDSGSIIRKEYIIQKTDVTPKIDGDLNEEAWQGVPLAKSFIERRPVNGRQEPQDLKTEVKLLYTDLGIYVGAMMYDKEPNLINKELTERDNLGNDDFFMITLNGYNDKQQSYVFIVTAAGVQLDERLDERGDDFSWNAVWSSGVKILNNGWAAELFIPYSELRFPDKKVQEWGLNIEREVRRKRSRYSWNHVDNKKNSYTLFDGVLKGIENIEPPTRLSFYPYASAYINEYDGETTTNFNGGMDVKYGINEAFTLDMTLVPDFGQANFDRRVLNLGPFEQQFNEQRAFFNEGIDLFTKGGLFYSRRIGGKPSKSPETLESEEVVGSPSKVKLINATKVSGRTSKGLGIGVFHSVTAKTKADIRNTVTGETREEVVEPLANYNIIALNQRFGGNSSVSLVNTHVLRNKDFRNSNVTGLYWDIRNKKNTYYYYGGLEGSLLYGNNNKFGTEISYGVSKISGKTRFNFSSTIRTLDYDINDLGFTGGTNYQSYNGWYQLRTLQPEGIFNDYNINFNANYSRRLRPDLFKELYLNTNAGFTTKEFLSLGGGFAFTPFGENDIYEPRENGKHLEIPSSLNPWIWLSTDYRKKFAFNFNVDYTKFTEKGRDNLEIELSPRIRFSDKWNMNLGTSLEWENKDIGFVTNADDDIVMGQRDVFTIENSLNTQYTFNSKTSLSVSLRHYVSSVDYLNFYHLQENGTLELRDFIEDEQNTYNSWNMDARFSWWFAPGSQLSLLYRNSIDDARSLHQRKYDKNFERVWDIPKINNLSLRVVYFLDYNRIKNLL